MEKSKTEEYTHTIKFDIMLKVNHSNIIKIYFAIIMSMFYSVSNLNVHVWFVFFSSRIIFTQSSKIPNERELNVNLHRNANKKMLNIQIIADTVRRGQNVS